MVRSSELLLLPHSLHLYRQLYNFPQQVRSRNALPRCSRHPECNRLLLDCCNLPPIFSELELQKQQENTAQEQPINGRAWVASYTPPSSRAVVSQIDDRSSLYRNTPRLLLRLLNGSTASRDAGGDHVPRRRQQRTGPRRRDGEPAGRCPDCSSCKGSFLEGLRDRRRGWRWLWVHRYGGKHEGQSPR